MTGSVLPLTLLAVACWPTLAWYVNRVTDGSDEPWGLASLATLFAIVCLRRNTHVPPASVRALEPSSLLLVIGLLMLYILLFGWAPDLVRAIVAATAFGVIVSNQSFAARFHVGAWTLVILSLPLLSSLQFYFGYPLRLLVSGASAVLLRLDGLPVLQNGTALNWEGQLVEVDAPCSGIRMLWAAIYIAALLVCVRPLDTRRSIALLVVASIAALLGNISRATALFFVQTSILDIATSFQLSHDAIGMTAFAFVVGAIALTWKGLTCLSAPRSQNTPTALPLLPGRRRVLYAYCVVALSVALVPLLPVQARLPIQQPEFSGFPAAFENRPLKQLSLSEAERKFEDGFPGKIGKFTDGANELVIRWISKETRQLHPASDCFRGRGYVVKPEPIEIDLRGIRWSKFKAISPSQSYVVRERIYDDSGNSWTDTSEWYWAAMLNKTSGPWWATTVIATDP